MVCGRSVLSFAIAVKITNRRCALRGYVVRASMNFPETPICFAIEMVKLSA